MFNPKTGDIRDAPSPSLMPRLVGETTKVLVTHAQGKHEGETLLLGVAWAKDAYKAVQKADFCGLLLHGAKSAHSI